MTDFPVYLFVLLVFASPTVVGFVLSRVRGKKPDARAEGYQPTITVVVPLYNEGESIDETILSLIRQEYPADKLAIAVVDDCSTDDSYERASRAASAHPNVSVLRNPYPMGRRRTIDQAARQSRAEIIVSVEANAIVFPTALRELVARFTGPAIGAVGGRVHVANPNQTWLSRLRAISGFLGQEHMSRIERSLGSATCVSSSLAAYRRGVLAQLDPIAAEKKLLGLPIQYGDDRLLTRQISQAGYRATTTNDAMCFTRAAVDLKGTFEQQARWRRTNVADLVGGLGQAWRLHPLVGIHQLSILLLLLLYPFVVAFHVVEGELPALVMLQLILLGVLGVVYHRAPSTRALPPWLRVHPLSFLQAAFLVPVAYLLLIPFGLSVPDAAAWDTRGRVPGVPR